MGKIFPWRPAPNPNKGRVVPDEPPPPPSEDRAVMRQLIKEAQAFELEKRAAILRPVVTSKHRLIQSIVFVKPELPMAFDMVNREMRKVLMRKLEFKHVDAIREWVAEYQKGMATLCAICATDITTDSSNMVPWEVVVIASLKTVVVGGVCLDCMGKPEQIKREIIEADAELQRVLSKGKKE